jgi:hypothetical protein
MPTKSSNESYYDEISNESGNESSGEVVNDMQNSSVKVSNPPKPLLFNGLRTMLHVILVEHPDRDSHQRTIARLNKKGFTVIVYSDVESEDRAWLPENFVCYTGS